MKSRTIYPFDILDRIANEAGDNCVVCLQSAAPGYITCVNCETLWRKERDYEILDERPLFIRFVLNARIRRAMGKIAV
jgi:hypothetical protein